MQQPNRLRPFFENITFDRDDNELILNFGPQHPSAHGQLRLMLHLQQEQITKAHPDIGYLHRGMEKMAENMIYNEFMPTTDRMDYIASSSNNYGFALAVERLIGLEVPRRAKVIRMMLLETNRLMSHLFWLATTALDIGAMTVFLFAFREREYLIEESLTSLEEEFKDRFVRIHRNALVARPSIAGFERVTPTGEGEAGDPYWQVVLREVPEKLPVSRRQWSIVKGLVS